MSHVASIEIVIKDLAALKAACKAAGLEFRENQKTWKWYGRWMNDYSDSKAAYKNGIDPKQYGKCDHAIGIPGNNTSYEIGVYAQADGTYKLAWDFWGGGNGLEKVAGKDCFKLVQSYAGEVAKKHLISKGFTMGKTKVTADGTVEMVFNHY